MGASPAGIFDRDDAGTDDMQRLPLLQEPSNTINRRKTPEKANKRIKKQTHGMQIASRAWH
jgi:hypothetical protein